MKIPKRWKDSWKMLSQQAFATAAALQVVWLSLDETQISSLPDGAIQILTLIIVVCGVIGRLYEDDSSEGGDEEGEA